MKKMIPVLLFCGLGGALQAQVVDTLWTRNVGGAGNEDGGAVTATSDGGFLIGGTTDSFGAGGTDFYLARLDSAGDTLWTRAYGHQDDDVCTAVAQRSDGLFLVAGYSFNRGANHWGITVMMVNDAGTRIGETVAGSTTADWFAYDLALTADGGYALAGSLEDSTGSRALLRKFDLEGLLEFEVLIPQGFAAMARALEQTADGGYLLAGSTRADDDAPDDFLLVRTDPAGMVLWTRTWGTETADHVTDLVSTPDGGFAFTGPTDVFSDSSDFYLVRLNANGDTLWTRSYGGGRGDLALALTYSANGFVLAGRTESSGVGGDVLIVRADSAGNEEWHLTAGGAGLDVAKAIAAVENGYIVAGTSNSFGAGDSNVFAIRIGIPEQTAAEERPQPARHFALAQNYPNPFNPSTRIAFVLNRASVVRLRVYDLTGREVARLFDGPLGAGEHTATFDAGALPSGIYLYRLEADGATRTRRMQLLK